MARYIDADELVQEVERVIDSNEKRLDISPATKEIYLLGMKHTLDFVKITPSADAVEVVRCKDCEWWTKQEDSAQGRCALLGINPTGAWYCGNAKMKD